MRLKHWIVLCGLVVLCLAGCGNNPENTDVVEAPENITEDAIKENSDNTNSIEDEDDDEDDNEPAVIATSEPLNLAHSDEYSEENYKPGKFSDNQNFATLKRATYSDKGFYAFDEDGNCLNFIDAKTGNQTVLCHDITCDHTSPNCNAWYSGVEGIYYNDGYVYVMAGNLTGQYECLYRLNADGSNKITVAKLFEHEEEDLPCSLQFIIHRGYGYFTINWMTELKREQILYKVSLEDGSKEELFSFNGYCPQICIESTEDDKVYFGTSEYRNGIPNEYLNKEYCYNASDGSITKMYEPEDKVIHSCHGNKIYMIERENEFLENGMCIVKKFAIYVADKDGKNSKCIYKLSDKEIKKKIEIQDINMDGRYIYIERVVNGRNHYLKVLDTKGKEILDLDNNKYGYCRWSDGKKLLLIDTRTNKYSVYDIKTGSIVSSK